MAWKDKVYKIVFQKASPKKFGKFGKKWLESFKSVATKF